MILKKIIRIKLNKLFFFKDDIKKNYKNKIEKN